MPKLLRDTVAFIVGFIFGMGGYFLGRVLIGIGGFGLLFGTILSYMIMSYVVGALGGEKLSANIISAASSFIVLILSGLSIALGIYILVKIGYE